MNLYCTKCHTCWKEWCWDSWKPCPFTDCDGHLTAEAPVPPKQSTPKQSTPKQKPTYPLLEAIEQESHS